MDADRQIAGELAAFIRENKDEIVQNYIDAYDCAYAHSHGADLPGDMRLEWIHALIEAQIQEIEGEVDPSRYETCGGDMVLQHEKALNPIMTYMESKLFFARFLAPYIWRRFTTQPDKLKRMFAVLERSVQAAVRANVEAFLDSFDHPGALSQSWDRYTMLGGRPAIEAIPSSSAQAPRPSPPLQDMLVPGDAALLTPRESQIAQLVVEGATNKQIARQLGLGLSTVKNNIGRIFDKYGVQSRTELVAIILKGEGG